MRAIPLLALLALLTTLTATSAWAARPEPEPIDPRREAALAVDAGERYLERAEEAARAGEAEKAAKGFEKAVKRFEQATEEDPANAAAWNGLGYSLRKTGDPQAALAAYDRALALAPAFHEAIEYRGEAYLALRRYDDVRAAYSTLFRAARPLADRLLAAAREHLAARAGDAADDEATGAFAAWAQAQEAAAAESAAPAAEPLSSSW